MLWDEEMWYDDEEEDNEDGGGGGEVPLCFLGLGRRVGWAF
jgi:hypothetical protein